MDRLRQATRDGVVVGLREVAGIEPRRDIDWLLLNQPDTFNLFLLALKELQDDPDSEKLMGYYQIAGIHGLPKSFWDGVQSPNESATSRSQSGYCAHSTLTFPTWHRPYLSMLEQAIYTKIVEIVERFPEGSKPKYRQAAQKFRLPYLDYYRPRGRRTTVFPGVRPGGSTSFNYDFSVPQIFLLEQVMVRTPPRDELTPFPNPLNSYRFPSQGSIPASQWSIVGADVATFSRVRTTRYPTARDPLRGDTASLNAAINREREPNTGYILNMILDPPYQTFASFATDTAQSGASGSLESIHGLYHVLLGGGADPGTNSGHMSRVPVAAFDPIFWLHHCQIDRWFAIWQATHPDAWFPREAGNLQRANLLPFRTSKSGNQQTFWTSDSSRSTETFGYTYPDLVGNAQAVRAKFQENYVWSTRTSTRPFGNPPPEMQPLDIGRAQVFQFTAAAPSNPTFRAAVAPPSVNVAAAATSSREIETAPATRSLESDPAAASKSSHHGHGHGHHAVDAIKDHAVDALKDAFSHLGQHILGHGHSSSAKPGSAPAPASGGVSTGAATTSTSAMAPPPGTSSASFTNLKHSAVVVADPKKIDESKVNRDWYVDDIVERLAANDSFTIYFFIGDFDRSDDAKYMLQPTLAGLSHTFAAPVEACDNCGNQEEQGHLITHTTPITPILLDYVDCQQLQSLAAEHVEPFLIKNLKWRIVTVNGRKLDPRSVAGLKIGISSKLTPIPPATGAPTYQEFPHVVEQIIASSS